MLVAVVGRPGEGKSTFLARTTGVDLPRGDGGLALTTRPVVMSRGGLAILLPPRLQKYADVARRRRAADAADKRAEEFFSSAVTAAATAAVSAARALAAALAPAAEAPAATAEPAARAPEAEPATRAPAAEAPAPAAEPAEPDVGDILRRLFAADRAAGRVYHSAEEAVHVRAPHVPEHMMLVDMPGCDRDRWEGKGFVVDALVVWAPRAITAADFVLHYYVRGTTDRLPRVVSVARQATEDYVAMSSQRLLSLASNSIVVDPEVLTAIPDMRTRVQILMETVAGVVACHPDKMVEVLQTPPPRRVLESCMSFGNKYFVKGRHNLPTRAHDKFTVLLVEGPHLTRDFVQDLVTNWSSAPAPHGTFSYVAPMPLSASDFARTMEIQSWGLGVDISFTDPYKRFDRILEIRAPFHCVGYCPVQDDWTHIPIEHLVHDVDIGYLRFSSDGEWTHVLDYITAEADRPTDREPVVLRCPNRLGNAVCRGIRVERVPDSKRPRFDSGGCWPPRSH